MNPPASRHVRSIRRRLLALLIVPALILLIAGTVVDYVTSIGPVDDAYDQALIDSALELALLLYFVAGVLVTAPEEQGIQNENVAPGPSFAVAHSRPL